MTDQIDPDWIRDNTDQTWRGLAPYQPSENTAKTAVIPCIECGSRNVVVIKLFQKPQINYRNRQCNDCLRRFRTFEVIV